MTLRVTRGVELTGKFWEVFTDITLDEVVQLGGVLDTSGTSANNDKIEQSVDLFFGHARNAGSLETVQQSVANLGRVLDAFHETRVFCHALDAKSG